MNFYLVICARDLFAHWYFFFGHTLTVCNVIGCHWLANIPAPLFDCRFSVMFCMMYMCERWMIVCMSVCVWYQCNWRVFHYYLSQKKLCISIYIIKHVYFVNTENYIICLNTWSFLSFYNFYSKTYNVTVD